MTARGALSIRTDPRSVRQCAHAVVAVMIVVVVYAFASHHRHHRFNCHSWEMVRKQLPLGRKLSLENAVGQSDGPINIYTAANR